MPEKEIDLESLISTLSDLDKFVDERKGIIEASKEGLAEQKEKGKHQNCDFESDIEREETKIRERVHESLGELRFLEEHRDRLQAEKGENEQLRRTENAHLEAVLKRNLTGEAEDTRKEISRLESEIGRIDELLKKTSPILERLTPIREMIKAEPKMRPAEVADANWGSGSDRKR